MQYEFNKNHENFINSAASDNTNNIMIHDKNSKINKHLNFNDTKKINLMIFNNHDKKNSKDNKIYNEKKVKNFTTKGKFFKNEDKII